jgi:hypothetical protein
MFRDKTILGDRLTARREWSQTPEVDIRLEYSESNDGVGKVEKLQGNSLAVGLRRVMPLFFYIDHPKDDLCNNAILLLDP